jgi:hypothetical protein
VAELEEAITEFLAAWNEHPKPYLDGDRGIHQRKTLSLPPDPGTDSTRLHLTLQSGGELPEHSSYA